MSDRPSRPNVPAPGNEDGRAPKSNRLTTVTNALDLLELLAMEPREWGVTELARHLDLNKSVVHGLLATLRDRDFVSGDARSRRYRLGIKAISLGSGFDLDQELRIAALPILRQLTELAGEASYLMVRRGAKAVTIGRAQPPAPIHLSVEEGARTPLHAGASGRVILAFSSPEAVDAVIAETGLPLLARRTITSRDALLDSLADIRAQGYAFTDSELIEGVFALAAPVFGSTGLVGSLGLVGITATLADRRDGLLAQLRQHADRLTQALGGAEAGRQT